VAPILSNLGWLLAGKGVGAVLSLVYLGLAARRLGPAQFGQFTLILATAQAIESLVGFQSWQIVVRFGMAHVADGAPARQARLIGFCTGLDLAASVLGCLVAWSGVALLGPALGWSAGLSHAALLFCVVSLLSVRSTAVGVLRLFDRFDLGAIADSTTPAMRFAGALVVVVTGPSVEGFLAAWAAAEIATAAAYWIAAHRVAAAVVRLPRPGDARDAASDNPGLWRFTWLTNLGLSLETVGRQLAVVLVGLATGPVVAGNYRLASQLSQSIVRISDMASRAIFAEAVRSHAGAGGSDLRRLFRHVTRLALAAAAGLALVLLFGRIGLELLAGPGHRAAYPLLRLLALAAAIDLAGVGFEPILLALGLARRALLLRAVASLCLVGALAVLLPRFGGLGAAWASVLAALVAFALFAHAASRSLRRR
jgi:O-antigen/teichoic acid export membrane protein